MCQNGPIVGNHINFQKVKKKKKKNSTVCVQISKHCVGSFPFSLRSSPASLLFFLNFTLVPFCLPSLSSVSLSLLPHLCLHSLSPCLSVPLPARRMCAALHGQGAVLLISRSQGNAEKLPVICTHWSRFQGEVWWKFECSVSWMSWFLSLLHNVK